jgi:hypothetical protein
MDFPISELMDEEACHAKLLTWLHPDGCWRGEFCSPLNNGMSSITSLADTHVLRRQFASSL